MILVLDEPDAENQERIGGDRERDEDRGEQSAA